MNSTIETLPPPLILKIISDCLSLTYHNQETNNLEVTSISNILEDQGELRRNKGNTATPQQRSIDLAESISATNKKGNRKEELLGADYLNYYINSQMAFEYGGTSVISSVNQANIKCQN